MRDIEQQIRSTRPDARDVSPLDPTRIRQRARRRDLRHRAGVTAASVGAIVVAAVVVAPQRSATVHIEPLGAATEVPAGLTGEEASRLLDGVIAAASVAVPEDRWDAVERHTAECMTAQGHEYTARPYPDAIGRPAEQRWDLASANRFNGTVWPQGSGSPPHPVVSDQPGAAGLTGDRLQAYVEALIGWDGLNPPDADANRDVRLGDGLSEVVPGGCVGQARGQALEDAAATARLSAQMASLDLERQQQVENHPDAAAAMGMWQSCLADAGVGPTMRDETGALVSVIPADQRADIAQGCARDAALLPTLVAVDHEVSLRLYDDNHSTIHEAAAVFGH